MKSSSFLILGVDGLQLTTEEAKRFSDLQPAGFILFSRNLQSPGQTRKLTDDLRALCREEPLIAMDQEGGRVCRTSAFAPDPPAAASLGAKGDMQIISKAAEHTANLLRLLGINFNLAPVLDLNHSPDAQNALRGRCWHRDPQRVIDFAGHWNRWLRKRGVASCAKHFPAGGRATSDPHHDLPVCHNSWDELLREDILPYTALMPELDAIMLSHVSFPAIDPSHPASLSPEMIRRKLRDQLGFDHHLVLTDDLDMGAITRRYGRGEDARQAMLAGNDLVLICHQSGTANVAVEAMTTLPHHVLDDAARRLERFRGKSLQPPLPWNPSRWESEISALAALPKDDAGPQESAFSPVEAY